VKNFYKEAGMEISEPNIRTGHPPHSIPYEKDGPRSSRILLKVVLFIIVFLLSFHLADFTPGAYSRRQTIQEILSVLERHNTGLAAITKEELAEVIYEEAVRHNHDPKFIMALIYIESEFFNWAVSEKGAKGLMQIMPYVAESIAKELGIEWAGDRTLFNPYLNIRMGIYYLSQLILDFDDLKVALAAYNYGPTYVKGLIERKELIPGHYYRRIVEIYHNI
jgi:soluble lytic murein transglycosylase-like protein